MTAETRRTSLGMLLRRSKSGDMGRHGRKSKIHPVIIEQQPREIIASTPPRLPDTYNGITSSLLDSFGGSQLESAYLSNTTSPTTLSSSSPWQVMNAPAVTTISTPASQAPRSLQNDGFVDPYARTESMTNRGRYSYASSNMTTLNSPRRIRRRKDPTPFNVLVIGTRGSGKTSFIESLKTSLALPVKNHKHSVNERAIAREPQGDFVPHYIETEIDHERVGLTIWDSKGLEKNVVDLQLREMLAFLESKFEETFAEEMKVIRTPHVQDTHIHAVFLILDPARLDRNLDAANKLSRGNVNGKDGGKYQPHHQLRILGSLDEDLDLQVMRTLLGKTAVIPLISKADTVTAKHMLQLKMTVSDSLKKSNLDPLEFLGLDDDESPASVNQNKIDEIPEEDEAVNTPEVAVGNDAGTGAVQPPDNQLSLNAASAAAAAAAADSSDAVTHTVNGDTPAKSDIATDDKATAVDSINEQSDTLSKRPSNASKRLSLNSWRQSSQSSKPPLNAHEMAGMRAAIPAETPYLPMSIISPDIYEPEILGRQFPWGFADPYNPSHCDFVRLKDTVFNEWRADLREISRDQYYEGWRTARMGRGR